MLLQDWTSKCEKLVIESGNFPTLSPTAPSCLDQALTLTSSENLDLVKVMLAHRTEQDDDEAVTGDQSHVAADR